MEAGGFIRSKSAIEQPNIQWHFFPGTLAGQLKFGENHGFQVHTGTMRDESRGNIHLQSKNPLSPVIIKYPYLSTKSDLENMLAAVRLTVEVCEQQAFSKFRGSRKHLSNEILNCNKKLTKFLALNCESAYHPCCTAAIGKVLDSQCKVLNTDGLRVVDASAMPSIISGNLNGPIIMLAEKAADLILGNNALKPVKVPVYENSNWEKKQR